MNLAGPLFVHRMHELSNAPQWCIARAFALADDAFGLQHLAARINALDLKVPAATQLAMMTDITALLRRLGLWFIVQLPASAAIGETIKTYRAGFETMRGRFSTFVSPLEARTTEARIEELIRAGVPKDVAEDVAILPLLGAAPEVVLLAETEKVPVDFGSSRLFCDGCADRARPAARARGQHREHGSLGPARTPAHRR